MLGGFLALQTIFGPATESWLGAYGWCVRTDDEGGVECAPAGQLYVMCLVWAFSIIAGVSSEPHEGPYPATPHEPGEGGLSATTSEMFVSLWLLVFGAITWAYVTAKVVDIIINSSPDEIAFKNRMDDLNRFIRFYHLAPDMAQKLRECAKIRPRSWRIGRA